MTTALQNPNAHFSNPQGINGIRFCEICCDPAASYPDIMARLGMEVVAESADGNVRVNKQGDAVIIENRRQGMFAEAYYREHGRCISALGFGVENAAATFEFALAHGAEPLDIPPASKLFDVPVLQGIGGSALYLIQLDQESQLFKTTFGVDINASRPEGVGFVDIDHLTHNVRPGNVKTWVEFYDTIFGFKPVFEVDENTRLGELTSMKTVAIMSPCKRFRIAVNEPTEAKSQIQQFIDELGEEGVQHIALSSNDLYASIEQLHENGIPFQTTPKTYYEMLPARMQDHGEDLARLESLGMLLDGENLGTADRPDWKILLQIFSRNLVGPAFFEFIQRKGNEGFGDNNAQALFESIEREQFRQGRLEPAD